MDMPRRRTRLRLAAAVAATSAVCLIGSGVANVVLGHGALSLSRLLPVAVGVVNLIAIVDIRNELRRTPPGRRPLRRASGIVSLTVAQAAAIPLYLVPLWTEAHSRYHDAIDWVVCGVALLLTGAALSITITGLAARPRALLMRKSWVVFVTLLPLFTVVQFWYATFYAPAHQRPNINVAATLVPLTSADGRSRVQASIRLTNDGSTDLSLFEAIYTLSSFDGTPIGTELTGPEVSEALRGTRVVADDDTGYAGLVSVGRLIRPGGHLVRGQVFRTSLIFDIPVEAAGKLRLTVRLSAIVDAGEDLGPFTRCSREASSAARCTQTEIPTEGWLAAVLSDDPMARVEFDDPPGSVASLQTLFGFRRSEDLAVGFRRSQQVAEVYPYLNSRGFTSSVESSLTPPTP